MQGNTVGPHRGSIIRGTCYLFLFFCCIPFLFPNPIVKTNNQPYAAILGTLVLLMRGSMLNKADRGGKWFLIGGLTFVISLIVMLLDKYGLSMDALRSVYNYYALFVIPCAVIVSLNVLEGLPERLFKNMIILWFLVATIQFFIYRGFATQLIGGVRWSQSYRGVVGLASEPSFLGIACFYFLHIVRKFKEKRLFYAVLVIIMGVLYAQSATGVMFLAGYFIVFLFDVINSKKGLGIWIASIIAGIIFIYLLNTTLAGTRLGQMFHSFFEGGVDSVLSDGSASVRLNAIGRALSTAFENGFIPGGFGYRIGSGYGSMLVELGFFAIPIILMISSAMAKTFRKPRSRIAYFIVVTLLLLNNTQMGNPLLLMVVGINLFYEAEEEKKEPEAIETESENTNDSVHQEA